MFRLNLRRITSSNQFIPAVDGLRFLCITMVVLFHLNEFYSRTSKLPHEGDCLYQLLHVSGTGVEMFFVISGMVLGLPFARHALNGDNAVKLGEYYRRRITRLEPPYLIALIVLAAGKWIAGTQAAVLINDFWLSALYANNFFHKTPGINYVTWSLEVEVQFYVLAPLMATVFWVKNSTARRLVLLAVMLAVGVFKSMPGDHLASRNVFEHLQYFAAGFLLADFYVCSWKDKDPTWQWDVIGALSMVAMFGVLLSNQFVPLLLPLVVVLVYASAFRGPWFSRLFSAEPFVTIGGMCYTIYLYHVIILGIGMCFVGKMALGNNYGLAILGQSAMLYPLVVLVSAWLFLVAERPFMDKQWPDKLWQSIKNIVKRPVQANPAPAENPEVSL